MGNWEPTASFSERVVLTVGATLTLDCYRLTVRADLGMLSAGVRYFTVEMASETAPDDRVGLLRVGTPESSLKRELQLREALGDYGMLAPIWASAEIDFSQSDRPAENVSDATALAAEDSSSPAAELDADILPESPPAAEVEAIPSSPSEETEPRLEENAEADGQTICDRPSAESDYLEEEYYEEISFETAGDRVLLVLGQHPDPENTLASWWQVERTYEECLSIAIQIGQCFSYLERHQWLVIDLLPQFIEIGKPLKIHDLTSVYPAGESLQRGLVGDYCAPELASCSELHASASSYTVGAILYQAIHQSPPPALDSGEIDIRPLPQVRQLLEICLSPVPQERFKLSELVSLLVQTRKAIGQKRVQWAIAARTTVGLSTYRLTNEDNYGAKQQQTSEGGTLLLGVVADGMGGLAQGELASQIAVQTVLRSPLPEEVSSPETCQAWLRDLFQQANAAIASELHEGGTTLSVVFACGDRLAIAHVGDSRIYLLRNGEWRQLSEDHSLVAMLVASGQITPQESATHPERNILTKSLGMKPHLSDGYVQDLERTTGELTLPLHDEDIILLCSDGIWDLVSESELQACFSPPQTLRSGVKQAIETAIARGASDNATLLALQCWIDRNL